MHEINKSTIAHLKDLLQKEKLSVIVGAGFSKNANKDSLDWKGLLEDMILEMYSYQAKQSAEYPTNLLPEEYIEISEDVTFEKPSSPDILKNKLNVIINRNTGAIASKRHSIELKKKEFEDSYFLVEDSFELSIKKEKGIIKLHGTLKQHSDEYGFDNDPKCKYIITSEDYKEYDTKHDAFVNLMRIALLQDSFCLFGFSGDDPNFLSWLSWVRDILDRRKNKDEEVQEKIFFVDVSGKPISKSKKLFYKNHYIRHVQLFDSTEIIDAESIKKRVLEFLQALNCDNIPNDKYNKEVYDEFWLNYEWDRNKIDSSYLYGYRRSEINKIWEIRSFDSLPSLKEDIIGRKRKILLSISNAITKKEIDEDRAKLFSLAFKGDFLPMDTVLDSIEMDTLLETVYKFPDVYNELNLTYLRTLNLKGKDIENYTKKHNNDEQNNDEIVYESILSSAFKMDYKSVYQKAKDWYPSDLRWVRMKVGLLSAIDPEEVDDYENIYNGNSKSTQEHLYYLESFLLASFGVKWLNRSDDYYLKKDKEIAELKQGHNLLDDNIKFLIEKLSKEKIEVRPYSNTSREILLGDDMKLVYSIQALQVLIDRGLPLSRVYIGLFNKEDWYRIFKKIYTRYPYPCLFFSLQFGDENKYIKRISEDYVYSNKLKPILPDILNKVLKAYQMDETPINVKKGILAFSQLFFKAMHAKHWREDFEKIANTIDIESRDEDRALFKEDYNFLCAGLENTNSNVYKVKVINKILSFGSKIDGLDNRILIAAKKNLSEKFTDRVDRKLIKSLIDEANDVSQYFVLFNMREIIMPDLWDKLMFTLINFDFKNCSEIVMFEAVSSYAKSKSGLAHRIENALFHNKLLWSTGISFDENGSSVIRISRRGYLRISRIQKNIEFYDQTVLTVYQKLIPAIRSIDKVLNERNDDSFLRMTNWEGLLLEMLYFLRYNKEFLNHYYEYTEINEMILKAYQKLNNANTVMDALISDDKNTVLSGLQSIVFSIEFFGVVKYTTEYLTIANRIVSKLNPAIQSCIVHFADILKNYHKDMDMQLFMPYISKILEVYFVYFYDVEAEWNIEAEKAVVEDSMMIINDVAKQYRKGNRNWNNHKRMFS